MSRNLKDEKSSISSHFASTNLSETKPNTNHLQDGSLRISKKSQVDRLSFKKLKQHVPVDAIVFDQRLAPWRRDPFD
jgi:hypothetical protein